MQIAAKFYALSLLSALLSALGAPNVAAQMYNCPAGSTQVPDPSGPGGSYMCRCPDGSYAGISGCRSSQPSCPAGMQLCGALCCGSGTYCSRYGCTPIGAVDCGNGYCHPGQVCTSSGRCMPAGNTECGDLSCGPGYHCGSRDDCMPDGSVDCGNGRSCPAGNKCALDGQHCISQDTVDCGTHFCGAGFGCGSGNQCLPAGAADCGNGTHCDSGKCSWSGKMCLTADQVDCGSHICGAASQCAANNECIPMNSVDCGHGHYCGAGQACGSNFQCMARDSIDCGGGLSCPAGKVCVNGGAQCLNPTELAQQRALQRQLSQQGAAQIKEDSEAEAWLKSEQAKLAQQAAIQRVQQAQARATAERESVAAAQKAAPSLCGQQSSCITTILQTTTLSSSQKSTQLAPIDASWHSVKTEVQTIIGGNTIQQLLPAAPNATGTPVQTIKIAPLGSAGVTGTPTPIGSPVSITGILQSLGNSKLVQIGLDSAASVGADASHSLLSGHALTAANALGNLSTVAEVAAAYKTGGWLAASQSIAQQTTVIAGGDLGAALMPTNPLVGKAIGTAISEGAIYAGTTYASPVIANIIFNADPNIGVK